MLMSSDRIITNYYYHDVFYLTWLVVLHCSLSPEHEKKPKSGIFLCLGCAQYEEQKRGIDYSFVGRNIQMLHLILASWFFTVTLFLITSAF